MTVSLTHDEFLQRWQERGKLFKTAIAHDLQQLHKPPNSPEIKLYIWFDGAKIELNELIGKLIVDSIYRVIDLVYRDLE